MLSGISVVKKFFLLSMFVLAGYFHVECMDIRDFHAGGNYAGGRSYHWSLGGGFGESDRTEKQPVAQNKIVSFHSECMGKQTFDLRKKDSFRSVRLRNGATTNEMLVARTMEKLEQLALTRLPRLLFNKLLLKCCFPEQKLYLYDQERLEQHSLDPQFEFVRNIVLSAVRVQRIPLFSCEKSRDEMATALNHPLDLVTLVSPVAQKNFQKKKKQFVRKEISEQEAIEYSKTIRTIYSIFRNLFSHHRGQEHFDALDLDSHHPQTEQGLFLAWSFSGFLCLWTPWGDIKLGIFDDKSEWQKKKKQFLKRVELELYIEKELSPTWGCAGPYYKIVSVDGKTLPEAFEKKASDYISFEEAEKNIDKS